MCSCSFLFPTWLFCSRLYICYSFSYIILLSFLFFFVFSSFLICCVVLSFVVSCLHKCLLCVVSDDDAFRHYCFYVWFHNVFSNVVHMFVIFLFMMGCAIVSRSVVVFLCVRFYVLFHSLFFFYVCLFFVFICCFMFMLF